jgi:hypothetical protein
LDAAAADLDEVQRIGTELRMGIRLYHCCHTNDILSEVTLIRRTDPTVQIDVVSATHYTPPHVYSASTAFTAYYNRTLGKPFN